MGGHHFRDVYEVFRNNSLIFPGTLYENYLFEVHIKIFFFNLMKIT